jgi:hypothetical protein
MRADGSVVRLEVLSDRRKVAGALFIHDILYERIKSVYLAGLLCVLRIQPTQPGGMLD